MRKHFLALTCALLFCCCTALAATSTTEYTLATLNATVSLADSYIVLREDNLAQHPELLASRNTTVEEMTADWKARNVLLQAWTADLDACLEIRAVQDEDAKNYFNISDQPTKVRTSYRTAHLKDARYETDGYDFKEASWTGNGKDVWFLQLRYVRTVNGLVTRGYIDKTIHNGRTVILDYQVYGRLPKEKDLNALKRALKAFNFNETLPTPATTRGILTFTAEPPAETNVSSFTVEGTATPGAHLIGVLMKYANPTPLRFEAEASAKTGKFKLPVKLNSEGIWLMTLTVEKDGNTLAEHVFDPTTYNKTLLPVTLDAEVPEQFQGDTFTLSGKTSKAVTVQCIVTGGAKEYSKQARTNNTGRFKFEFSTGTQSEYSVTLVFSKKNYDTRRFTWTANRTLTEKDIQNQYKAEAVKPAYTTLNRKLEAYTGRVMGYKVYITDIQQAGEEYVVFAAMTKTKKGALKDIIVIETTEEPNFVVGSEQRFYGRLAGQYEVQSEENTESYPLFELLFWDQN